MATGRIRREDIATVRSRARIEEVVGAHVTLKNSGVDSLSGLCPFHDERTPSFHVRPSAGYWHCFGCGEGGDVITFVEKIDHLSFVEAVEFLASKYGVTLNYEEGAAPRKGVEPGTRQRLLEAHRVAEEFYRQQLATPAAHQARRFLGQRGFDAQAAQQFSLGYSPQGWDALTRHLRANSFTQDELVASGLVSQGNRGVYDRFRGRLMWPIKDLTGATIGFGARRLSEDDKGPKYLNTPETVLYKKSQVLYGIDLAKREIAKRKRIVVVEGYTDVMAAHLAGEPTAVATCGTAFGSDHVRIVRRLLGDNADPAAGVILAQGGARGGEVIFTFDGDEAGQKAALKAFKEDQYFASQTFVAVEPNGMDPCDVRLERGDRAVLDLIESREPLFEFAIRSVLSTLDLNTAEGRVAGLNAGAPVVARIRDKALRSEYARLLAGWLAMDEAQVRHRVAAAGREVGTHGRSGGYGAEAAGSALSASRPVKVANDPVSKIEGQALEALLQQPWYAMGTGFDDLPAQAFSNLAYRSVHEIIRAAGGVRAYQQLSAKFAQENVQDAVRKAALCWRETIDELAPGPVKQVLTALVVAPLPQDRPEGMRGYVMGVIAALERMVLIRQIGDLRSELGRMDPTDSSYEQIFSKLMGLEARRRALGAQH